MEAKAVPALRSKRGLRPARRVAEPQVVGVAPQTTKEKKADTMKTYLLKTSPAVEPKAGRKSTPITTATNPGPSAATPPGPALFIGLDVHNDSIADSIAPS